MEGCTADHYGTSRTLVLNIYVDDRKFFNPRKRYYKQEAGKKLFTTREENSQDGQKIKVKFTLEKATKVERGSRGIAVFFNLGATGGGWSTPGPGHFTPGKTPVRTA